MSAAVKFIQRPPGCGTGWRQSAKGERLLGWLLIEHLCKEHGHIERFRIPVLSYGRRGNRQRPFCRVHFIQKEKGHVKIYNWITLDARCLDVGPKEIVDVMYRVFRGQTLGFGQLEVSFVEKNGKTSYCVFRAD